MKTAATTIQNLNHQKNTFSGRKHKMHGMREKLQDRIWSHQYNRLHSRRLSEVLFFDLVSPALSVYAETLQAELED